jgi:hypothetical protein
MPPAGSGQPASWYPVPLPGSSRKVRPTGYRPSEPHISSCGSTTRSFIAPNRSIQDISIMRQRTTACCITAACTVTGGVAGGSIQTRCHEIPCGTGRFVRHGHHDPARRARTRCLERRTAHRSQRDPDRNRRGRAAPTDTGGS